MNLPSNPAKTKSPRLGQRARLFLLMSFAMLLGGCVQLAEVDSTHSPLYAPMIGRTFELREDFYAYGIKLPDQRAPAPEYILIMPPPRIRGHLIVDLGRVPAGSRFRIVGVVTRKSKLFPSTEYSVSFDDARAFQSNGKPVRINATTPSWKLYIKPASPEEVPQLNEEYFRPVDQAQR